MAGIASGLYLLFSAMLVSCITLVGNGLLFSLLYCTVLYCTDMLFSVRLGSWITLVCTSLLFSVRLGSWITFVCTGLFTFCKVGFMHYIGLYWSVYFL